MRTLTLICVLFTALGCTGQPAARPALARPAITIPMAAPAAPPSSIEVRFAPGDVTSVVVAEIGKARTSVAVRAYSLTSARIAKSLIDARARGVAVRVLMDEKSSHGQGCVLPAMLAHPISHSKTICVDGKVLVTGSWNFSAQADSNAENVLIRRDHPEIVAEHLANFELHLKHARQAK